MQLAGVLDVGKDVQKTHLKTVLGPDYGER